MLIFPARWSHNVQPLDCGGFERYKWEVKGKIDDWIYIRLGKWIYTYKALAEADLRASPLDFPVPSLYNFFFTFSYRSICQLFVADLNN